MPPSPTRGRAMPSLAERAPLVSAASCAAEQAASRAGVTIVELDEMIELGAAAALLDEVWGTLGYRAATPELLRGFSHTGNYVAGAYREGELVGALVGHHGRWHGQEILHSHILGVRPGQRSRGVGAALKLHQRSWALERDRHLITWTFDPLVRRNASFNLSRLGALPVEYLVDFYGRMNDEINGSGESDRLLVAWELGSPRVRSVCDEQSDGPPHIAPTDVHSVISVAENGSPRLRILAPDAMAALIDTPDDIVSLRQRAPAQATVWRTVIREAFAACAAQGMRPVQATRTGQYLLIVDGPALRVEEHRPASGRHHERQPQTLMRAHL